LFIATNAGANEWVIDAMPKMILHNQIPREYSTVDGGIEVTMNMPIRPQNQPMMNPNFQSFINI